MPKELTRSQREKIFLKKIEKLNSSLDGPEFIGIPCILRDLGHKVGKNGKLMTVEEIESLHPKELRLYWVGRELDGNMRYEEINTPYYAVMVESFLDRLQKWCRVFSSTSAYQ